jgi:NlpC/P60 family
MRISTIRTATAALAFAFIAAGLTVGAAGTASAAVPTSQVETSQVETVTPAADSDAAKAVRWAKARIGHTDWNRQCELFVERAYGTSGRFATATAHYKWQKRNGRIHTGSVAPAGSVVFFTSDSSAGHVMLAIGGGKAISTGPKVYQSNNYASRRDYLGWAYVPSSWPGL